MIHMTPQKSLLTNNKPLHIPYLITLPNGYKVKVTCTGSLSLYSTISLPNILIVPSFHYNLISLCLLLLHLQCNAFFETLCLCFIARPFSGEAIGSW